MRERFFKKRDLIPSIIAASIISIPLWVNLCVPNPTVEKKPWDPYIDTRDYGPINAKKVVEPKGFDYDWEKDARQETPRWNEFLEDIQNRGLEPWDPEAIEMWDSNYN